MRAQFCLLFFVFTSLTWIAYVIKYSLIHNSKFLMTTFYFFLDLPCLRLTWEEDSEMEVCRLEFCWGRTLRRWPVREWEMQDWAEGEPALWCSCPSSSPIRSSQIGRPFTVVPDGGKRAKPLYLCMNWSLDVTLGKADSFSQSYPSRGPQLWMVSSQHSWQLGGYVP